MAKNVTDEYKSVINIYANSRFHCHKCQMLLQKCARKHALYFKEEDYLEYSGICTKLRYTLNVKHMLKE